MNTLNYKHLRYFWMVAKAGSVARAARLLHLTPHSVSAQLVSFEDSLGVKLFRRVGRRLELSDAGERILTHAEEIFALGDRIVDILRDQRAVTAPPFRIGITDAMPKSLVYTLLEPALKLESAGRLICREGLLAPLLTELAIHRLDLVIADRPLPPHVSVKGYSHLLGSSPLAVFGAETLLARLPPTFPALLHDAPFLLPGEDVASRAALLQWLETHHLHPRIVAELDDSALMKAFGQAGAGLFVAPAAISGYICEHFQVREAGRIPSLKESVYAITTERQMRHPVMSAISDQAKKCLA